jgi:hypothetical protein
MSLEEDQAASADFAAAWDRGRCADRRLRHCPTARRRLVRLQYIIHVHVHVQVQVRVRVGGSIEILLDWSTEPDRSSTLGTVLSARRAAKRRLEDRSQPGSPDWVASESEMEHFRAEYRRLARESARRNPAAAS